MMFQIQLFLLFTDIWKFFELLSSDFTSQTCYIIFELLSIEYNSTLAKVQNIIVDISSMTLY